MLTNKKVLAIDDTPSIRTFLRILLEDQGATFYEAGTAREGLKLCREVQPDLVVLDLGLPDIDGLAVLSSITRNRSHSHRPAVVVLTVRKEPRIKEEAFQKGAVAYLTKPFLMEELLEHIQDVLEGWER